MTGMYTRNSVRSSDKTSFDFNVWLPYVSVAVSFRSDWWPEMLQTSIHQREATTFDPLAIQTSRTAPIISRPTMARQTGPVVE